MPQQNVSASYYGFPKGNPFLSNGATNIYSGPCTITVIETAKNTLAVDCYLLFYNALPGNIIVGTTIPARIIPILAGTKYQQEFAAGGMYFSPCLSAALVSGSPTGNTEPTTPFGVDIVYQ